MKIRNGFVSNSSSSSFVVLIKNGEKMTKEMLNDLFDIKENSILFGFSNILSNWILNNVKELSIKDIFDNYSWSEDKNLSEEDMINGLIGSSCDISREDLEKISNKEYRYYEGSASDDTGDGLETFLCETGINVNTDTIYIKSGGNY